MYKYGENEWSDLIDFIELNPSRTPNEIAIKWRQIKQLMMEDIKRVKRLTNGQKIVTKHEWMIAALESLEENLPKSKDLESPRIMYEAMFIDPSKLTPY